MIRPRDVTGEFGIYVHVPFCVSRCWYCDFNAYAGLDHLAPAYMRALATEASWAPEDPPSVTSVFFGGGTPSLVDADDLLDVLRAICGAWPVASQAEVTVECNPESVDPGKLEAYRRGGVTRLSFGVQSLDDRILAALGRTHDADTALKAIRVARECGFDDVNADLIFGAPGEDHDAWRRSVEGVIAAGPEHVSCYGLTYEEGTPLHDWRRLGKVVPVPDDDMADRWEWADEALSANGFVRYEISNWARPGRECRHNLLYWACGEYLGVGAGAHSHVAPERSWNVKAPAAYARAIEEGRRPVQGSETPDREPEVMFLGLRRARGVTAGEFEALTGRSLAQTFGETLDETAASGLLDWDGRVARLTRRGTLLANEALSAFL